MYSVIVEIIRYLIAVSYTHLDVYKRQDEEWLKDPERVYPVIVDPITTTSKDVKEIIDACVDSQDAAGTDREGLYLKTRGGDIIQSCLLYTSRCV